MIYTNRIASMTLLGEIGLDSSTAIMKSFVHICCTRGTAPGPPAYRNGFLLRGPAQTGQLQSADSSVLSTAVPRANNRYICTTDLYYWIDNPYNNT